MIIRHKKWSNWSILMQMAAYIAKFAAIFVWFVWLCSNVQIVHIQKTSVSGLWAHSSFKIGQNVASTSTIQQFIIFLDLFFGAFLTSCPIVGRAARWQRPARPQNVQAVHLSVQFFFRLLPRSSWSGLQIWSGWLVLIPWLIL